MITAGIDAGSRAIKVIIYDHSEQRGLSSAIVDQGVKQSELATLGLNRALEASGRNREDLKAIVATGYGRNNVDWADTTITEITCHARGVVSVSSDARTVVEIGGQDNKLIRLDENGRVRDFAMNDRCAAGTGRFLEVVANRLGVDLPTLSDLGSRAKKPALISSMCVVFAETEIIGLLAEGTSSEDIASGVQRAIATRVSGMAGRLVDKPIYFTGGVALQPGMIAALRDAFECEIHIPPKPQFTGALGAAILAGQLNGMTGI